MTSVAAAAFMAAVDQERAALAQDAREADHGDLGIGAVKLTDLIDRFLGVIAYTQEQADAILQLHQKTCTGGDCAVDSTLNAPYVKLTVAEPAPLPMLPPMLIDRFLSPSQAKLLAAQLWAAADHAEEKPS